MAKITELSQLDRDGSYSYADYLTWRFDEAVELIRGKISLMSPAPNSKHQDISAHLLVEIGGYLKGKSCKIFHAPFDVRLYDRRKSVVANKDIYTVVQPDLCVICDKNKLDTQGCVGAPDWIIEILSKSTAQKDAQTKFQLYQEAGVKEYWLVYPGEAVIAQFLLDEQQEKYQLIRMFSGQDQATPCLFPDLSIDLEDIFFH